MNDTRRKVAVAFHEPVVGGAAIAVLRILPLLEARGWRFVFWAPGPGPLHDELEGRGYEVSGEPRLLRYSRSALAVPPGAARRLGSVPGYLGRFRRWVARQSPAIVHANTLITIPEAMAARTTGAPVLLYVHEILPGGVRGAVAARLIRASVQTVVTNSAASVAALRARRVRTHMSYYGIELPPAGAPRPDRDGRPIVVGTLGTISHRKGSDVFLAAAERIRDRLPDVEFRMIGPCPDGPEREWAQRMVDRAAAAGVRWGTTDDAFAELSDWDLLALPSRREPFGLVLIEAMAVGLPVVATRIDGPREIVTADSGLLVDLDDADALASAIVELAGDPTRREAMGAAGRARVEREFTLDNQAEVIHRAYLETAARS